MMNPIPSSFSSKIFNSSIIIPGRKDIAFLHKFLYNKPKFKNAQMIAGKEIINVRSQSTLR